jgi:uncharacterized tellurite resistance protein B-like protein
MIDMLLRLVSRPAEVPPADEGLAFAALLVEAARADGDYAPEEKAQIGRILAARFGLDAAGAARLRAEGEAAQAEAADVVRYTRAVKETVAYEDRLAVIEALWEVIYADGEREMHESALMRKLCGLLHLADQDSGIARQRVVERLGVERSN